jgi:hypothetical protein
MSREDWHIIKQGTWLYAGQVVCDIRIVKHHWRYGSGDYEDNPEDREDRQGEFYYIQYGSTIERGIYPGHGVCCDSLEEAIKQANSQTQDTVRWAD